MLCLNVDQCKAQYLRGRINACACDEKQPFCFQ